MIPTPLSQTRIPPPQPLRLGLFTFALMSHVSAQLPKSSKAPHEIVTIQEHGGWTGFNDPRAIVASKHLIDGILKK